MCKRNVSTINLCNGLRNINIFDRIVINNNLGVISKKMFRCIRWEFSGRTLDKLSGKMIQAIELQGFLVTFDTDCRVSIAPSPPSLHVPFHS